MSLFNRAHKETPMEQQSAGPRHKLGAAGSPTSDLTTPTEVGEANEPDQAPEPGEQTVYPLPQEQQPDPVYGFDDPPPAREDDE